MYEINAGEGKHQVCLRLWETMDGWIGSLTGGETPHVGGVVLAVPRDSLTGAGTSCDIWAIPVPGHLDNEVAVPLVKQICVNRGVAVSLTAGIHIDNATSADIALIRENCQAVVAKFFDFLEQETR